MNKIVSQQVQEAQENYSKNISQISEKEFAVSFSETNSFRINLPSDYPSSPPRIFRGKSEFPTAMTKNWCPIFTFLNLVEHLKICSSVTEPQYFELNKDEVSYTISSSEVEDVSTKKSRLKLLSSSMCPTTDKALKQSNYVSNELVKEQEKVDNLKSVVSSKVKQLNTKPSVKVPPQSPTNNKDKAIKMYTDEAAKIEDEISDIINNTLTIDNFRENKDYLYDLYERMYLLQGIAQLLEDRLDL